MSIDMDNMTDEEFEAYMNSDQLDADVPPTEDEVAVPEEQVEEPVEPEQPEQDSVTTADDATTDDTKEEEPDTTTTEGADPEVVESNDNSETEVKPEVKPEDDVLSSYLNQVSKVKANKTEVEFTNQEKIEQFDAMYQKAANYTKKTQKLAQYGKRISAMEEAGITDTQFNTMLDVLKGDKDAITSVIKGAGIDALEIDTEQELNYTPSDYGKSNLELEVEEAYQEIDSDPEGVVTKQVISSQWDDKSREHIVNGMELPNGEKWTAKQIMTGLHEDVKTGVYDVVSGIATKLKIADGGTKSDIEYYVQAGGQYSQQQAYAAQQAQKQAEAEAMRKEAEAKLIVEAKAKQAEIDRAKAEAEKRQSAAVTQTNAGATNATDYLAVDKMTDDEFLAFMDKQIG